MADMDMFKHAYKRFERNNDKYIFQVKDPLVEMPRVGVNDFKSLKNKEERKRLLRLTIEILEDVSKGKINKNKIKKVAGFVEKYNLSLDIRSLLKPSGYLIYTIHGLQAYENPRIQQPLMRDIISFTKESKALNDVLYSESNKKVLDYGCGVGWFGYLLSRNFRVETFGFDIDENAIKLGSFFNIERIFYPIILESKNEKDKNKDENKDRNITLFRLPFINEVFDIVISKAALFETPAKGMASFIGDDLAVFHHNINEIERVLKQKGILLVETNLNKETMLALIKNHQLKLDRVFYSQSTDKEWKLFVKA